MRLLIISDVHANFAALQCAAKETVDAVAFVGDAVAYGPQPMECVGWLRSHADFAVRGNHDNSVVTGTDPHCSVPYREMAAATAALHRTQLSEDAREYLGQLPLETYFTFGGARFYAVHAAPDNPLFQYLPADLPDEEWEALFAPLEADVILTGHTHRPLVRQVAGKTVINPGSVGQPKGGDPRAAYAIWEDGKVLMIRQHYPIEETVEKLREQPLPPDVLENLITVLRTGDLPPAPDAPHAEPPSAI